MHRDRQRDPICIARCYNPISNFSSTTIMEFWPEFLANSWGREFVAGGFGGMAGVIAGHPLDTLKIRLQQPTSSLRTWRSILKSQSPSTLYTGMGPPLATVAIQNAVAFQTYAVLSRALEGKGNNGPASYMSVAMAGVGAGAIQTGILTPVELIKIRLQVGNTTSTASTTAMKVARNIMRREGVRGLYRGLGVTILRDAPAHGVYFWTYEYSRESLHPGCRRTGEDSLATMVTAGGLAGVASWVVCYPLDVVKSRLQAQDISSSPKYHGIIHCFNKSVREEGLRVLWRGLGTAVARAFVVNGAIFSAYELALRCFFTNSEDQMLNTAI